MFYKFLFVIQERKKERVLHFLARARYGVLSDFKILLKYSEI